MSKIQDWPAVVPAQRVWREITAETQKAHPPGAPLTLPIMLNGFLLTTSLTTLCQDIVTRMPRFWHIDLARVLIGGVGCRNSLAWGSQARIVPMRFAGGHLRENRKGNIYQIQRVFRGDCEIRYLIEVFLPRFLNQTFDQKMITLFHELSHISPRFDGDIRRTPGGTETHGRSQAEYDRAMADLARSYLASRPPAILYDFLRLSFAQLLGLYGKVCYESFSRPKLLPIARVRESDDRVDL